MRRLVLAPHPDDEVLWCFSALKEGTNVLIFTDNERLETSVSICDELVSNVTALGYPDTRLPEHTRSIIRLLELELKKTQYDEIYIPSRAAHQDHVAVHDAAKIALRLGQGIRAKVIEYPYLDCGQFETNLYRHLSCSELARKEDMIDLFVGVNQKFWKRAVITMNISLAAKFTLVGGLEPFNTLLEFA